MVLIVTSVTSLKNTASALKERSNFNFAVVKINESRVLNKRFLCIGNEYKI